MSIRKEAERLASNAGAAWVAVERAYERDNYVMEQRADARWKAAIKAIEDAIAPTTPGDVS